MLLWLAFFLETISLEGTGYGEHAKRKKRKEIRSKAELVENAYTSRRKPFLTGASIAISILLAFYSGESLKNFVLLLLTVVIAFGVIMFWLHNSNLEKIHSLILSTDDAFLSAIDKLNYFRDYFSMDTYFLENINEEKLASFFTIIIVLIQLQHKLN